MSSNLPSSNIPMNFAEMARDKVRGILMDMIPDDQIEAMIQKEFNKYFVERPHSYNQSSKTEFETLVYTEMKTMVQALIKERMTSLFTQHTSQFMGEIDNGIVELMKKCQNQVLQGLVHDMAMATVQAVVNNNGGYVSTY